MRDSLLTLTAPGAQLCANLLEQGLKVRVRVSGTSMAPLLAPGDVVVLDPLEPSEPRHLRIGDILFIQDPQRGYYLHRLIRCFTRNAQPLIQTRGHGHWRLDNPVSPEQVLARVTDIEHHPSKSSYWLWLANANQLWARVQFCQSAGYYLMNSLTQKLQRPQSIAK